MESPEEKPLKHNPVPVLKKKSIKDYLLPVRDNITVEPVLFCYFTPAILTRIATQNLYLDKACRVDFKFGDAVCDSLLNRNNNDTLQEEIAVQKLIASMEVWKNFLVTMVPTFMILFLGAWSDRTGKRRVCIIMPIVGELLTCLSMIISVYYFYEIPLAVVMFLEGIFPLVTGAMITMSMGAFSYLSDITSADSRTFRLGMANLCITAGIPLGSALSGVLLNKSGYYGAFGFSAALKLFCVLYAYYCIPDPEKPADDNEGKKSQRAGIGNFCKSFFDIKHVKNTFYVAFRKGPNKRRTKSLLILLSIFIVHGLEEGEYLIRYLFTRYRFNWDVLKFSTYNTVHVLGHCIGTLISIAWFNRYLKWHDSVLGLISSCCKIAGAIIVALARTNFVMYLSVVIETFNATSFTTLRSLSSKLVTNDELGQMTSVFNVTEMLASTLFNPLYAWMYKETITLEASAVFYTSALLTTFPAAIYIWFFIQQKNLLKQAKKIGEIAEEKFINLETSTEPGEEDKIEIIR